MSGITQPPTLFETVKCIIHASLTNAKAKLLAWDHNIDNEYRMSMNFIQNVRFIHNEFSEICHADRSNVDVKFHKQCSMEIRFPLDDEMQKKKVTKEVVYLDLWIVIFNWDLELNMYKI